MLLTYCVTLIYQLRFFLNCYFTRLCVCDCYHVFLLAFRLRFLCLRFAFPDFLLAFRLRFSCLRFALQISMCYYPIAFLVFRLRATHLRQLEGGPTSVGGGPPSYPTVIPPTETTTFPHGICPPWQPHTAELPQRDPFCFPLSYLPAAPYCALRQGLTSPLRANADWWPKLYCWWPPGARPHTEPPLITLRLPPTL